nr:kinesin-like protein KIN-14B [Tanacetum cinerariifolium]
MLLLPRNLKNSRKRDALIERSHEENEKLFERLTEKASSMGSHDSGNGSRMLGFVGGNENDHKANGESIHNGGMLLCL